MDSNTFYAEEMYTGRIQVCIQSPQKYTGGGASF